MQRTQGNTRAVILATVESFLAESGISGRVLGIEAVGDNKAVLRLRRGQNVTLDTIERIESFIDARRGLAPAAANDTDVRQAALPLDADEAPIAVAVPDEAAAARLFPVTAAPEEVRVESLPGEDAWAAFYGRRD